jgi:hypothetical protein
MNLPLPAFDTEESTATFAITMDYLSDLFTASGKETFSKLEVLHILNLVRGDSDLVDQDRLMQFEASVAHIGPEE